MDCYGLADLVTDLEDRVHGVHRALEHDRDSLPPNIPHLRLRELDEILPLEHDLTLSNVSPGWEDPEKG